MRTLFSLYLLTVWTWSVFAQTSEETQESYENFWQYGKEVGLNVTPLVRKFVPFNLSPTLREESLLALKTKWYGKKAAFIFNFGIDAGDENISNSIFLSFGYEKRRNISEKWKYTTGWEVTMITLDNENNANNDPILGVSKPYGIEYHFFDNFYLATEGRLVLGVNEGPVIKLLLPTALYFGMLLE